MELEHTLEPQYSTCRHQVSQSSIGPLRGRSSINNEDQPLYLLQLPHEHNHYCIIRRVDTMIDSKRLLRQLARFTNSGLQRGWIG